MSQPKFVFVLASVALTDNHWAELLPTTAGTNYVSLMPLVVRCTPDALVELNGLLCEGAVRQLCQQESISYEDAEQPETFPEICKRLDIEWLVGLEVIPGRVSRKVAPMTFDDFDAWFAGYYREKAVCDEEKEMLRSAFNAARETVTLVKATP